jgi:hypothetical protein
MRTFFGFAFLILACVLLGFQVHAFFSPDPLKGGVMFLMILLTTGSLGVAVAALLSDSRRFAGGLALLVCAVLVLLTAILALTGNKSISGWEYFFLVFYGVCLAVYGLVGVLWDK